MSTLNIRFHNIYKMLTFLSVIRNVPGKEERDNLACETWKNHRDHVLGWLRSPSTQMSGRYDKLILSFCYPLLVSLQPPPDAAKGLSRDSLIQVTWFLFVTMFHLCALLGPASSPDKNESGGFAGAGCVTQHAAARTVTALWLAAYITWRAIAAARDLPLPGTGHATVSRPYDWTATGVLLPDGPPAFSYLIRLYFGTTESF